MTCKACGKPYGCDHSDAEYQGVVPPMTGAGTGLDRQIEQFVSVSVAALKQIGEAFRR